MDLVKCGNTEMRKSKQEKIERVKCGSTEEYFLARLPIWIPRMQDFLSRTLPKNVRLNFVEVGVRMWVIWRIGGLNREGELPSIPSSSNNDLKLFAVKLSTPQLFIVMLMFQF